MSKVTVPATVEDAVANLNGIGALLTTNDWERAAIVYAYTEIREQSAGRGKTVTSDRFSFAAFAARDITGLRSKSTVQ